MMMIMILKSCMVNKGKTKGLNSYQKYVVTRALTTTTKLYSEHCTETAGKEGKH